MNYYLAPCPCGETPTELGIVVSFDNGHFANGNCCGRWIVEFRNDYQPAHTDECKAAAIKGWNETPRAPTEWKPISTAPLDGRFILLYRPDSQFVGYYGGANSGWRYRAPLNPSVWPLPTHWAELPPKPCRPMS